jgi:protein-tyrosine phosphatase
LRTIVDFRSEKEIEDFPDKKPASVTNTVELIINPGRHSSRSGSADSMGDNGEEFMKEINRLFVTDSAIIDQYRAFFALLQDENEIPLLFHCTAGKDRTGMGAALFLASLGVDEKTIFEDYLLSNKQLEDKYRALIDSIPNMKPLLEVRPQYLQAGFEQIKKDHGNIEKYLQDVLKVDLDHMKKLYLE